MSSTRNILNQMKNGRANPKSLPDNPVESNNSLLKTPNQIPDANPNLPMDEILRQALTMGKPAPKPQIK